MNAWLHVGYNSQYIYWVVLQYIRFYVSYILKPILLLLALPPPASGSDKGVYILTLQHTPSKKRFQQLLV